MFSFLLFPAINHLLAQEPWATQQLQVHSGKTARIDFQLFSLRCRITSQGYVESAPEESETNVTIHIKPADIPLIMQNKERAISYVKLEGDADLAQTFAELAKNLRWDTEHELSRWFGDIAGRRLAEVGRAAVSVLHSNTQKLQENVAEYFLEENRMLMRSMPVTELGQEVTRLRDDVERLQKRIEKCEKVLHRGS